MLNTVPGSWFLVESGTTNAERRTANRRRGSRRAFSLIEVSLALLVVSVGILSVLSLFPMGLDQNARAIADSHAGLFADEVMSGLRACAETNWAGLNGNIVLPVAADAAWGNSATGELDTLFTIRTNIYKLPDSIVDHALRYQLMLATNGNIKAATLYVWGGEFGATGTTSAPSIFYEEFFNYRPQ